MGARVAVTSSSDEKLKRAPVAGRRLCCQLSTACRLGCWRCRFDGRTRRRQCYRGGPSRDTPAVDPGGHIALIAVLTWSRRHASTAFITVKQIRLQRLMVGNHREQAELVRGMEPAGIKPVIDRSLPLKQLADAITRSRATTSARSAAKSRLD